MQTHHFRSSVTLCRGAVIHRPHTKTGDAWRRPRLVNAYATFHTEKRRLGWSLIQWHDRRFL